MQAENSKPPVDTPPPPEAACGNCGTPLSGKYCYACGQPVNGLVRHFGSVMGDIADSLFNIDARLFRTIWPLYLRPGKLTLDYFEGKRARYVTPFRLVFFLAIITFFTIQLSVRAGYAHMAPLRITTSTDVAPKISIGPAPKSAANDQFAHGNIAFNDKVIWNRDSHPLKVGWLPDAAVAWLNDLIGNAQQQLYAMNNGTWFEEQQARRKFTLGMFSAAPTVLFLMLPLFALLLKIFYIFKKRLYMEHLIVAMHSHAFLMLSMLILVLLRMLRHATTPQGGWPATPIRLLETAAWIWIFVYLWLMQKRAYRQGWWMTNLKYWSLGFCYTIMISLGFVFAVLLSLTGA